MFDNEGHYIDDPLDIVNPKLYPMHMKKSFKPMEFIKKMLKRNVLVQEHQTAAFADFDKMVAHLARVHNLHQDEIGVLLAAWFDSQPSPLRIHISQEGLTKEQFAKLREAVDMLLCNAVTYAEDVASGSELDELIIEHIVEPFIEPLINGRL